MANVFEERNIPRAILKIGIPAMLGQLTTLIYNLADTYFVALTKVPAQIAAVTLCVPALIIIMSIACVFGMGASSVIARQIGEGKKEESARCFNFSTYAMIFSGILVLIAGLLFIRPIASVLGADEENMGYTCDYLRWILMGAPAVMLANGLVHSFRSVGLIKEATIGLALGNAVNIVLDWVLIVLMNMGTKGAAMATSIGFVCATFYYIACLWIQEKRKNELVSISPKRFRADWDMAKKVIQIGIPGALITVLMSIANIVLNNYIGIYGSDAVASYGIAYKIDMFPIMLSVGLSQGTAPLLGYYFGKGDAKNLTKAMGTAAIYGIMLGAVFSGIIFTGSHILAGIFLSDEALIAQTGWFLRLLCFHSPLLGIINMVTSYFQALGKAVNSLVITLLRNVVLFIPGVIVMNTLFKLNGVILTQLVVEIFLTVICIIMYRISSPRKLMDVLPMKQHKK